MKVPFVDLSRSHDPIRNEIDERIMGCIERSGFILGKEVEEFERHFADYCEAEYCVGVDSGTSALELILRAWGVGPGDEVIVPANTFIGTAAAVSFVGATPVPVDVTPDTMSICPKSVSLAVTSATKAVIPVHLYGHPADMDSILEVTRPRGIRVLEDACQAHGACYKGSRVGGFGDAAAFSFHPTSNLGAFGDAGAVVTSDRQVAERIATLRNYGQAREHVHTELGYNRRLDSIQAAVLNAKLPHLDQWNAERRALAAAFDTMFESSDIKTLTPADWAEPVYSVYPIFHPERDKLAKALEREGIECRIHYPTPIHLQETYRGPSMRVGTLPLAEACCNQELSLPLFPGMIAPEVDTVIGAAGAFLDYLPLPVAA